MSISYGNTVGNTALDAFNANFNNGTLKIYAGSVPATADATLGAQVLLGTLAFSATAFATASGKSATANAITQDVAADASGIAAFYRAFKADGTTVIEQGAVGTSGAELNLNTTTIVAGGPIQVTSFIKTV